MEIDSVVKYTSDKAISRKKAMSLFTDNSCDFILGIGCLDQGVDIPSCQSLIMLASSRNPRQYVQRRGRVLRNPTDGSKTSVKIFDIFSLPLFDPRYEGLIEAQILRAWEFLNCSNNKNKTEVKI